MPTASARLRALSPLAMIGLLAVPLPLACQDADGPLFSEKAREIVEDQGADAALGELSMMLGTARDEYEIDIDGLIELGREYAAGGDHDAAVAVLTMTTYADPESADAVVALADVHAGQGTPMMAAIYYEQAMALDPDHPGARAGMEATGDALPAAPERPTDRPSPDVSDTGVEARGDVTEEKEAASESSPEADPLARLHEGPRRADLERFKGRYRAPDDHEARPRRVFWVGETCLGSGYLMAGAEWGDVAPWIFRTESDLAFVQTNAGPYGGPVRLEFVAPADGQATGLEISGPLDADLERIGDLFENSEREGEDCLIQLM